MLKVALITPRTTALGREVFADRHCVKRMRVLVLEARRQLNVDLRLVQTEVYFVLHKC